MGTFSDFTILIIATHSWDGLIRQFEDHTVFHLLPWLRATASTHRLKIALAAAMSADECVAMWPILSVRKGLFRVIGSPLPGWSTAYLGPVFKPGVDPGAVTERFLKDSRFRRYSYFACKVLDRNRPVDLSNFGFSLVQKYDTYRLNLTLSESDLWANLRRECRNHIRKAQKSGVEVRFEQNSNFIDEYWAMSVETFAKAQVKPTHSKRCVVEMWNNLFPAGQMHALSAFHGGERIGTIILLGDTHAMYYWGGASHLKHRNLSANNLLQWEGICFAKRSGLTVYDFISTTGGPGKFKQSFGPTCVTMATHWERSPSRLLGALKRGYERHLRNRQRLSAAHLTLVENAEPVTSPASAS